MPEAHFVYITSSWSRCLYVGMTGDLVARVGQHKGLLPRDKGFTALYRAHCLVYIEAAPSRHAALVRERQIKQWRRAKKLALIQRFNSRWLDLAAKWPTIEWPE